MKNVFFRLASFTGSIIATIAAAIFLEIILDFVGLEYLKHSIGTAGTILILCSFTYSLRKRKCIFKSGDMKRWLIAHEWLAIVGSGLIFVHGGFHGHAFVPLLTSGVMLITVVSGLTGRYIYLHARKQLQLRRKELEGQGLAGNEIDDRLSTLTLTHDAVKKWRTIHVPMVFILIMTTAYHILSALYYDGFWR